MIARSLYARRELTPHNPVPYLYSCPLRPRHAQPQQRPMTETMYVHVSPPYPTGVCLCGLLCSWAYSCMMQSAARPEADRWRYVLLGKFFPAPMSSSFARAHAHAHAHAYTHARARTRTHTLRMVRSGRGQPSRTSRRRYSRRRLTRATSRTCSRGWPWRKRRGCPLESSKYVGLCVWVDMCECGCARL